MIAAAQLLADLKLQDARHAPCELGSLVLLDVSSAAPCRMSYAYLRNRKDALNREDCIIYNKYHCIHMSTYYHRSQTAEAALLAQRQMVAAAIQAIMLDFV